MIYALRFDKMDLSKLQSVFVNNLFTDLTLILQDKIEKITLEVHKVILFTSCEYFTKLLTNCQEKNASVITMQVANAQIMRDIILSFYGEVIKETNKSRYHLEKMKCLDFLGIKINLDYLENNAIPKEDFDLLLDVMDIIGYNAKTIAIIAKNIPEDYDLRQLPRELLQEIVDQETSLKIAQIGYYGNTVELLDYNDKISKISKKEIICNSDLCHLKFLSNGKKLASIFSSGNIVVRDIHTGDIIEKNLPDVCAYGRNKSSLNKDSRIFISSNEKILVCLYHYCHNDFIAIWNLETEKMIKLITCSEHVSDLHFSLDNHQITTFHYNSEIKTWNVENGDLIDNFKVKEFDKYGWAIFLKCSPDLQKIVIFKISGADILDYHSKKILYSLPNCSTVFFSPDNQKIVCYHRNKIYMYDANNGVKLYDIFIEENYWIDKLFFVHDINKLIIPAMKCFYIYQIDTGELIEKINVAYGVAIKSLTVACYSTPLADKIKKILASNNNIN